MSSLLKIYLHFFIVTLCSTKQFSSSSGIPEQGKGIQTKKFKVVFFSGQTTKVRVPHPPFPLELSTTKKTHNF